MSNEQTPLDIPPMVVHTFQSLPHLAKSGHLAVMEASWKHNGKPCYIICVQIPDPTITNSEVARYVPVGCIFDTEPLDYINPPEQAMVGGTVGEALEDDGVLSTELLDDGTSKD